MSRRFSYSRRFEAMVPCGPVSAATAAACADRVRPGGALRLELDHRLDQRRRPGAVADAPARHRVGLGNAVHRQRAVLEVGRHLGHGGELDVAIDQVLVDVVGQHPDVGMAPQHLGQCLELGTRVGRPARVVRRVQHQPARLAGDGALQVGRLQLEARCRRAVDEDRNAAGQQGDVGVGHPVGRRHDHLVTRRDRAHERVEDHLLGAGAHDDLVRCVGQAVLVQELAGNGFLQHRRAAHVRVAGLAVGHGSDCRFLDVLGCLEVGLARGQAEDVPAHRAQLARPLAGHGTGGWFDSIQAWCDVKHARSIKVRPPQDKREIGGARYSFFPAEPWAYIPLA